MLDISNCDVLYYVIYVICSHYVGKAISPLFAWPSSYVFLCRGGCPYFRSGLTQPGTGTRSCIDIHNLEFWHLPF